MTDLAGLPSALTSWVRGRRWVLPAAILALVLVVAFIVFSTRVSALQSGHEAGPSWSFPARVYSDGVTLAMGRILPADYLTAQLEARGYRVVRGRPTEPGTFARDRETFEIALRGFAQAADTVVRAERERVRLRILDGRVAAVDRLGAARAGAGSPRLEPVLIGVLYDERDPVWRTWVPLERVPVPVRDAIVAAEDRRFTSHFGVDLRAWARALVTNVRAGEVREGGSTITQQLARSLFLGRRRSLWRKISEVPLAVGLEMRLGKRRILEMYLNATYWGQSGSTGIGGIEAASRWYFDAPVESLGVLEGATLAAIIPAPNVLDPFKRPALVRKRRDQILKDMVDTRRLTAERAAALARRPLNVRRGRLPGDRFPSYTGFVRERLATLLPGQRVAQRGLSIFTRMDLVWQQQAERGLAEAVAALDVGGRRQPPLEGAFVALEPMTGAVRAMVGGRAPHTGDFNRAYQARRQTGSAIKPIVYAAALSDRRHFTPATIVTDVPRTFQTDLGPWSPHNDDWSSHAEVTLVKALEKSLNVATTNVVDMVGPKEVARVAQRFGLGTLKPVMSIGLGSNECTLFDLTRAFAVFGDGGFVVPPSIVHAVADRTGKPVALHTGRAQPVRAIEPPVAALMTGLLTNVVRFGVAYPLRSVYGFLRPVAGKTGTTDDYKDAWFLGFTPDIVAGVWLGYDRPRSLNRLAMHTALPAWARIVTPMLDGFPPRPFVSDGELEWHSIDPWSGMLPTAFCQTEPVPFLPGTAPTAYCTVANPFWTEPESTFVDSLAPASAPADTTAVEGTD
ncbi:MAG TPA: transglycosylase domain-containing protein [Candidatus Eisenbacteria bacterium]|nr:transglycosylase domain-containing protein [Candidatus Eisenbacteria bacterium]